MSTASYEAREFGVRSGMPLRIAVRRCPDAVLLPVDKPAYDAASAVVMDTVRAVPGAVVEVLGWDEAFVGVETDDPEAVARRLQADVLAATALHCSVGIGDTKVRAKIATEFGKPRGTFRLTRENWFEVMGERPDRGPLGRRVSASRSGWPRSGSQTVRAAGRGRRRACWRGVRPADRPALGRLGRGESAPPSSTTPPGSPGRTAGRRPTSRDLDPPEEVEAAMRVLAEQVVDDIRVEERRLRAGAPQGAVRAVLHRQPLRKLAEPTWTPAVMADTAFELYRALEDDRPVRLLGVRAEMVPPEGGYEPPRTHGRRGNP